MPKKVTKTLPPELLAASVEEAERLAASDYPRGAVKVIALPDGARIVSR